MLTQNETKFCAEVLLHELRQHTTADKAFKDALGDFLKKEAARIHKNDKLKKHLLLILGREKREFKKTKKSLFIGMSIRFLKAEHDYGHFLEKVMQSLKNG